MKFYFIYLKHLENFYTEVFKEDNTTFRVSLSGAFFLISQVGLFYEIVDIYTEQKLPFPENHYGFIIAITLLGSLNYYLIRKKLVLEKIIVKTKYSIMIVIYLVLSLILTLTLSPKLLLGRIQKELLLPFYPSNGMILIKPLSPK